MFRVEIVAEEVTMSGVVVGASPVANILVVIVFGVVAVIETDVTSAFNVLVLFVGVFTVAAFWVVFTVVTSGIAVVTIEVAVRVGNVGNSANTHGQLIYI